MLSILARRNRETPVRKPANEGLTTEDFSREITGLVSERSAIVFSPNMMGLGSVASLGDFADRSTRLIPTFLIAVVLPTVLTLFYLVAFATPQFESEGSFSVQQGVKSQKSMTGVAALAAQFSGVSTTSQETYMVLEYLRSNNVIEDIGGRAFLEPIYARDDIDYMSRMGSDLHLEDLHDYWESKIIPELDTRSGIITLKVRAFSPKDAYLIAQKLMVLSEDLVNRVSLRSREDTLTRVEGDLKRSVALLADSQAQLLTFRNQQNSLDPVQDADNLGTVITELTLKRIQLETEIGALLTQVSADSPALRVKREQSDSLQQQIDSIESRMTSMASSDGSIAKKLVDYEKLKINIMYYEKLYSASMSTYQQAREDTLKQQIFIIPIVIGGAAESSSYPSAWQVTVAVFLLCLALWAIAALTIAAVKDHRI